LKAAYTDFSDSSKNPLEAWYELIQWARKNTTLFPIPNHHDLRQIVKDELKRNDNTSVISLTIDGFDSEFFSPNEEAIDQMGGDIHTLSDTLDFEVAKTVTNDMDSHFFWNGDNRVMKNGVVAFIYPTVKFNEAYYGKEALSSELQMHLKFQKNSQFVFLGLASDCDASESVRYAIQSIIDNYGSRHRMIWLGPISDTLDISNTDDFVGLFKPNEEILKEYRAFHSVIKKPVAAIEPYPIWVAAKYNDPTIALQESMGLLQMCDSNKYPASVNAFKKRYNQTAFKETMTFDQFKTLVEIIAK
jgi:hypothetical protein